MAGFADNDRPSEQYSNLQSKVSSKLTQIPAQKAHCNRLNFPLAARGNADIVIHHQTLLIKQEGLPQLK